MTTARVLALLLGCPGLLVEHTVLLFTCLFICAHGFFSSGSCLSGDLCPSLLRLTSLQSPRPSVCFIMLSAVDFVVWKTARAVKKSGSELESVCMVHGMENDLLFSLHFFCVPRVVEQLCAVLRFVEQKDSVLFRAQGR